MWLHNLSGTFEIRHQPYLTILWSLTMQCRLISFIVSYSHMGICDFPVLHQILVFVIVFVFVFVWILGSYLSSPGDLWLSCSPSSNSFPGITSPTHGSDTRGLKFKKIRFLNGSSIQLVCVSYGTDLVCLGNMGKWGSEKMILSPTWPLEQISNDSIRQLQVLPLQLLLVDVIHHRLADVRLCYWVSFVC